MSLQCRQPKPATGGPLPTSASLRRKYQKAIQERLAALASARRKEMAAIGRKSKANRLKGHAAKRLITKPGFTPGQFYSTAWMMLGDATGIEIDRVIDLVCDRYAIGRLSLMSPYRTANLIRPRHISMYLAKEIAKNSFPEIGRKFGGRDHTTILSAYQKIRRLRATDSQLDGELNAFEKELGLAAGC